MGAVPNSEPDVHVGERQAGRREVAVAAVERHLAPLVRAEREPPRRREGPGRQSHERGAVRLEELAPGGVAPVVPARRPRVRHGHQRLVVPRQVAHRRHGHERVAADEAHLGLDGALLVAGVRVAEGRLEAEVQPEAAEQRALAHLAGGPPADPGRVVEHDAVGHPSYVEEDGHEALAHALGGGAAEDLEPAHVGLREREHQVVEAGLPPSPPEVGLAEVALRGAGRPDEVEERRRRLAHGPLALPHVFCQALLSRSRHGFVSHFPSPDDGRPTGSVTTK